MQQNSPEKTGTFSQQIQQRMSAIERRDWELWLLALAMVGILAIGYFFVIFPSVFLGEHTLYVQAKLSSPLAVGQLALVLLFLIYVAHKHLEVRRVRSQSLVDALNFQLSHAQLLLDPLTHAFNRTALEEVIGKEIKRAQRKQTTLVFLYVDLDDLKSVNSRFGHLSGDLVLSEAGAILKSCVRGSDYVIRMGGDEFLLTLVDTTLEGAVAVKNRINLRCERWNQNSPLAGFILSMSIGVQEYDGTLSFDEVLAQADNKMYTEKQAHAVERKRS
ncbi:MAG: GGDEF domain-containing protein [Acidobacteria bacterium]|nr:GGDEF domain-containing protein [Acidobacteriota bacterium]